MLGEVRVDVVVLQCHHTALHLLLRGKHVRVLVVNVYQLCVDDLTDDLLAWGEIFGHHTAVDSVNLFDELRIGID